MTYWNFLILKFNHYIENYKIEDFELRLKLIKIIIGVWIILMIFPVLVYQDFVYDFDILEEYFKNDLIIRLFYLMPYSCISFIKEKPYLISLLLSFLVICQTFARRYKFLYALLICIILNFHFCLTYMVNSGATVIVTNFASFVVVMEFLSVLQRKFGLDHIYKLYVFFAMKLQMCIVYLVSGLVKLFSPLWVSGAATYYIFSNQRYFKSSIISDIVQSSSLVEDISSYSPIVYLLLFPLLVWTRKAWLIIAASLFFHGFIAIFMGLREFLIFPLLDFCLFCDVKSFYRFNLFIEKIRSFNLVKRYRLIE
jgi:hypothetical protein